MARIEPLERQDLTEMDAMFSAVEGAMGFVPTSLLTMARIPAVLKAFAPLAPTIMGPGSVDIGLKALVAQISSAAAGCRYCQAHTAEGASHKGVAAEKVANVWLFETSDLFSPAERAALTLARDASVTPNASSNAHFDALAEHFSEEQVVEIVSVISLFGFLNRWNDTLQTPLEDAPFEFATANLAANGWDAGAHRD